MGSRKDRLGPYEGKRDFDRTPEPAAGEDDGADGRRFVIHKHEASSLHYDFRLEFDGVLKSWAVPKGPSTDPREKRLAIRTEDHPPDYADFEGVIPEDQYGGGTVMVWDTGTYRNLRAENDDDPVDMTGSMQAGLIELWLQGEKLEGGYALKRIEGSGEKAQWLLIKMDDGKADARRNPVSTQDRSAKTGRSMHQIRKAAREQEES